jgi:hypothetical protein
MIAGGAPTSGEHNEHGKRTTMYLTLPTEEGKKRCL